MVSKRSFELLSWIDEIVIFLSFLVGFESVGFKSVEIENVGFEDEFVVSFGRVDRESYCPE